MPVGNLSMQHVNPERRLTVLGSDERPEVTVMPVAVTMGG